MWPVVDARLCLKVNLYQSCVASVAALQSLFNELDTDHSGSVSLDVSESGRQWPASGLQAQKHTKNEV